MAPHGPGSVQLPVRLTVRCEECGHTRSTIALHDNALARAQRCERCGSHAEVVASMPLAGCSCCG